MIKLDNLEFGANAFCEDELPKWTRHDPKQRTVARRQPDCDLGVSTLLGDRLNRNQRHSHYMGCKANLCALPKSIGFSKGWVHDIDQHKLGKDKENIQ